MAVVNPAMENNVQFDMGRPIEQVTEVAFRLLEYIPGVCDMMAELKQSRKEVNEAVDKFNVSASSDPAIARDILELQKHFRDCISEGNNFLEHCFTMATYATNEEHVDEIKEELDDCTNPSLESLKQYLDDLCSYLQDCEESLNDFQESKTLAENEVEKSMTDYSMKTNESEKDIARSSKEVVDAHGSRDKAKVEKYSAALHTAFSFAAGVAGIMSPQVSITTALVTCLNMVGARLSESDSALKAFKEEQVLKEKNEQQKVFKVAISHILKLKGAMNKVFDLIKDMHGHAKRASELITGNRGLKKLAQHAASPTGNRKSGQRMKGYYDIKNKLEALQRATGQIVEKINDGYRISEHPDELISTKTQQSTDTKEQSLEEELRKTLNIHVQSSPQQNGSAAIGRETNV